MAKSSGARKQTRTRDASRRRAGTSTTGQVVDLARRRSAVRHGLASVNPATGEVLRTFEPTDERELETRLARAAEAFLQYRHLPLGERARSMRRVADILDEERDTFARLMTTEMGKPLRAAGDEVVKCAWACRHYAEQAPVLLADEPVDIGEHRAFVRYQPLGPVLAVMPWNFPFWQVFRFAAPALMAGNVALLKHASNVPECALAIEDIFRRAGFADGVFQTLLVESARTGGVIDDPRVVAVTLTGSDRAGSEVAARAGAQIKKTVLELGGSDPFIVMPSADMDETAAMAVRARTINNGQSCIAAKRFIVVEAVADEFERRFTQAMQQLRVGDPMEPTTDVGPLATEEILLTLEDQVKQSVAAGARVLTGGARLEERPGYYYAPTILADVPAGAPAYREELFGPVAVMLRARDAADAVRLANDTPFGLGASVWTRDEEEQRYFIEEVQAGLVFVNGMVASDPRLPFGGIKRSGYGRELGIWGVREFVNVKTVWLENGAPRTIAATE
jgi:succinate-semialdehyde dehydrogenase/glutarate-semialdehyde dehydrogenase